MFRSYDLMIKGPPLCQSAVVHVQKYTHTHISHHISHFHLTHTQLRDFNVMPSSIADNMFEVCLLKNTSGLGFSFSREENIPGESPGTSMVRVKKLFPGQPAAESGHINVGDVILRVNQTPLKGLSQHVCKTSSSFYITV